MALMSEESLLLVRQGVCELVELPNICDSPSAEVITQIKQCEQRYYQ